MGGRNAEINIYIFILFYFVARYRAGLNSANSTCEVGGVRDSTITKAHPSGLSVRPKTNYPFVWRGYLPASQDLKLDIVDRMESCDWKDDPMNKLRTSSHLHQ